MPAATSFMAAAAVVGAATGVYGAYQAATSKYDPGAAPAPGNYYEYDSDGNLVREQVWDDKRRAYVSKTHETEQQKADARRTRELRNQFMGYLKQTPEDRIKAYDEYAATFSKQLHKDVDEQYGKTVTASEELMNKRGLTGSRAYVDTMSELSKEKTEADTDIAQKSALAKEALAQNDRSYWLNAMNSLDTGMRADQALAMNQTQTAANIANQGTAATLGAYAAQNNANLQKWQQQQYQANNWLNTSSGLMFLYGLNKGGGALSPTKVSSSRQLQGLVDSSGTGLSLYQ